MVQQIQSQVSTLFQLGYCIVLCLVSGHVDLPGNAAADDAAMDVAMNGGVTTYRSDAQPFALKGHITKLLAAQCRLYKE